MKKNAIITVLAMLFITLSYSQEREFDGLWSGKVTKTDGDTYTITLFIEDNNVYGVTLDEDEDLVKNKQFEVQMSKGYGQQLNFFWMNKGGVWSETQMFSLSWNSESELSVYHMRHVSNEADENDGNTDWGYFASGILTEI